MHEKHFRFHRCIESLHDLSEHSVRDPLGRLPQVISRKHPIDIRVIYGPEAFLNVQGIRITAGNDQDLMSGGNASLRLKLSEFLHQLGTTVQLRRIFW